MQEEPAPERVDRERVGVADDDETRRSPRDGDIEPLGRREKAEREEGVLVEVVLVGPRRREGDEPAQRVEESEKVQHIGMYEQNQERERDALALLTLELLARPDGHVRASEDRGELLDLTRVRLDDAW